MNFGRSSNYFKHKMNHNFNFKTTFKNFMTYNLFKNASYLNNFNKNGMNILNRLQKMNYITISSSATMTNSVSFLLNDTTSNDGMAMVGNKMNSDFLTLLNEIFRLDEQILENGSILRLLEESSMTVNSLRRSQI